MNCELIERDGRLLCERCGRWTAFRLGKILRRCDLPVPIDENRPPEYLPDIIPEPVEIPEPTSCVHRGELLRVEECKPCQSGGRLPEVFACAVHGECTLYRINKRKPDGSVWASCLSCGDRVAVCISCDDRADA